LSTHSFHVITQNYIFNCVSRQHLLGPVPRAGATQQKKHFKIEFEFPMARSKEAMARGKQQAHTAAKSTGSAPQSKTQASKNKRPAGNDAALAAAAAAAAENAAAEPTPPPSASSSDDEAPPAGSAAQAAHARNKSNQDSENARLREEIARLRERLDKVRWLCNV
jgi:hypothetical protein